MFPGTGQADWARHPDLLDADGRLVATYEGGRLLASLAAEGLSPADVDLVVPTHLHRDHVVWTSDGAGGLTFSRARQVVARAERNHWQGRAEPVGPDPATVLTPLARV